MANNEKLDSGTLFPSTRIIEAPIGRITVNEISVREYLDAQSLGTYDDLIRAKMIVSVAKSPVSPPTLAVDLKDEEMEDAVKAVRDDNESKLKSSTILAQSLWGGASGIAAPTRGVAELVSGANFLRANALARSFSDPTVNVRSPEASLSRKLLDIDAEKARRERLALEAQVKTADMLEAVHLQLVKAERQNQKDHELQRRIFAAVLATLALTAVGVVATVVIQLT